jgi:ketosteroid isomerase-like protein
MRQSLIVLVLFMLMGVSGCVEVNDKQQISDSMKQWKRALQQEDIDMMLSDYSEDYQGEGGETKEQVHDFLEGMKSEGVLSGTIMDLSDAEVTIDGDTATVEPIRYVGDWGEMATSRVLKKEKDNTWRVIETSEY